MRPMRPGSGTDAALFDNVYHEPTDITVPEGAAPDFSFQTRDREVRTMRPDQILTRGATGWAVEDFFGPDEPVMRMARRSQMRNDGHIDWDDTLPLDMQGAYNSGPHDPFYGHDTRNEDRWVFFIVTATHPRHLFEIVFHPAR